MTTFVIAFQGTVEIENEDDDIQASIAFEKEFMRKYKDRFPVIKVNNVLESGTSTEPPLPDQRKNFRESEGLSD